MCEDDPVFSLGELHARLDAIDEKLKGLHNDVNDLKEYKSKLVGVGATVSFGFMAVGFLFGDIIRSWVKRLVN